MKNNEQTTMVGTRQMRTCTAHVAIEVRAEEQEGSTSRVIEGCAVRFNEWSKPFWDQWIERIDPHAFDTCDMSDVVMCPDHSRTCANVLARKRGDSGTLEIRIEADGLYFRFEAPRTNAGDDILELVRRGDITECSFAFIVEEDRWQWKDSQNRQQYDQRTIMRIGKLFDLALVVSPQYDNTTVAAERSAYDAMRRQSTGIGELIRARDFLQAEEQTF